MVELEFGNPGYYEKESQTVLDVSLGLQKIFEKKDTVYCVIHSYDARVDSTDSLKKRVEFAQKNNGENVSIHANGSDMKNGQGTETFYYQSATTRATNPNTEESRLLAEKPKKRLVEALATEP